ncbi:MAG TPA: hypothetical protein VMF35_01075 [Acidimicrobiales bacterium]|nr:hypothetical protein [Acidimicrobiales bacterium]
MPEQRRGRSVPSCPDHPGAWVIRAGRFDTKSGPVQRFRCCPQGSPGHTFSVPAEPRAGAHARRKGAAPLRVRCPIPEHANSNVQSRGTRQTQDGPRRVYSCQPDGAKMHTFRVTESGAAPALEKLASPPRCPEHPFGRVVRNGPYGKKPHQRQRYRCYPEPNSRQFHTFTPPLPRNHVHLGGESCPECEEVRGVHRGDLAVSRHQSWSSRVVAQALRDLAVGLSYANVSRNAIEGTQRKRSRADAKRKPEERRNKHLSRNAWHIAADWCEVYSPVLYAHVEQQMRGRAMKAAKTQELQRERGEDVTPRVIVIDDLPVYASGTRQDGSRTAKRDYFVLALAETFGREAPGLRLRILRAVPAAEHYAWKLVFDELGYTPDFIVADAATGIVKAVNEYYRGAVTFVPSLVHVRQAIEVGLHATKGAYTQERRGTTKFIVPAIAEHLFELSHATITTMTSAGWSQWWDDLERGLDTLGVSLEPTLKRRDNYEATVAAMLPALAGTVDVPVSSGGLETLLRNRVLPVLHGRSHAFANIERTNRLLDLVVCYDRGLFRNMSTVVSLIRGDSANADGWSTPLRAVTDRQQVPGAKTGRYSSLRDVGLVRDIARAKKLA